MVFGWTGCDRSFRGFASDRAGAHCYDVHVGDDGGGGCSCLRDEERPTQAVRRDVGLRGWGHDRGQFWSLLAPAIDLSEAGSLPSWVPPVIGFLLGGIFLRLLDRVLPHLHPGMKMSEAEGIHTSWRRSVLLVSAITLHNIPEGLAVGVAFGAVAVGIDGASLGAAIALAVGIGLQNFPEGTAVSMPLRREGMGRGRSFFYGQLSAVVEPVAAVIGAAAVLVAQPILPYALAFAAGAMIFVVAEELIPEAKRGSPDIAAMSLMVGFAVMMTLDVALV